MKIVVAAKDRSADLGREIREAAAARARPSDLPPHSPEHSALSLKETRTEKEYHARFLTLLAVRHAVSASIRVSRRPGLPGLLAARFQDAVWRLVHHRVGRIVRDQNVYNELLALAADLENRALRKEVESLSGRLAEVERRAPKAGASP